MVKGKKPWLSGFLLNKQLEVLIFWYIITIYLVFLYKFNRN